MVVGGKKKTSARSIGSKVMDPIDVTDMSMLGDLKDRIKKGPITMILVYAPWCGHCQTYKPLYEKFENNPNRNIQIARVRDDMVDKANITNAKIEGYPSVILVNKENKVIEEISDNRNEEKMNSIVENNGQTNINSVIMPEPSTNIVEGMSKNSKSNFVEEVANEMPINGSTNPVVPDVERDRINANANINSKKKTDSIVYAGGGCGCPFERQGPMLRGGSGIFGLLQSVATDALPAAVLLGTGAYLASSKKKTTKKTKTRKNRRSQSRKTKSKK